MDLIKNNPALITSTVAAALVLLVAFGVPVSEDQKDAVIGITGAVLALLAGVTTRALVTPLSRPRDSEGRPLVPAIGATTNDGDVTR